MQKLEERFKKSLAELEMRFKKDLSAVEDRFLKAIAKQNEDFKNALVEQKNVVTTELKEDLKRALREQKSEITKELKDYIDAIGARWGIGSEYNFHEGMKKIIEEKFGGKVTKWTYTGKIPKIHLRREKYEVDVVISNENRVLAKIKGSITEAQVEKFYENCLAYEYINKVKAKIKILIGAVIDPEAIVKAKEYDIELTNSL